MAVEGMRPWAAALFHRFTLSHSAAPCIGRDLNCLGGIVRGIVFRTGIGVIEGHTKSLDNSS